MNTQSGYPAGPAAPYPGAQVMEEPVNPGLPKWAGAALIVLAVVVFLVCELGQPSTSAPKGFTQYASPDNRCRVDGPMQWDVTSEPAYGDDAGGVVFKNGVTTVSVTTEPAAKIVGEVGADQLMNSNSALPEGGLTSDPLEALHKYYAKQNELRFKDYLEQGVQMVETNMGGAEVSEFTGSGGYFGLGGQMHGYQASVVNGNMSYEIMEQCPEKNWKALEPAFMHVITSIEPGNGIPVQDEKDSAPAGPAATGADNGPPTSGADSAPPTIAAPKPPDDSNMPGPDGEPPANAYNSWTPPPQDNNVGNPNL